MQGKKFNCAIENAPSAGVARQQGRYAITAKWIPGQDVQIAKSSGRIAIEYDQLVVFARE